MAYEVGNKVMVDGEECEVVGVIGEGVGYLVEVPGSTPKKVFADQVSEVEEEKEPEPEPELCPPHRFENGQCQLCGAPEPAEEPEPKHEGIGEGGSED